jgi:hypothetical protein
VSDIDEGHDCDLDVFLWVYFPSPEAPEGLQLSEAFDDSEKWVGVISQDYLVVALSNTLSDSKDCLVTIQIRKTP